MKYILRTNTIGGYSIYKGFIANITSIIFDNIVIEFIENFCYEKGFATTRRTININTLFELDIFTVLFIVR
jgi:hypothetical protein